MTTKQRIDRPRFFIGGEWVEPLGGGSVNAIEAATEEIIGTAALGSAADVERAVDAAETAFTTGPWSRMHADERSATLHRFAEALEARGEETSVLGSRENGMPLALSQAFNAWAPAALLRQYADLVTDVATEEIRSSPSGSTIVRREAVGVTGVITPWNYPQAKALISIAPALAAGCTAVLKHSPDTPLDAYIIGEAAAEAGVPAGVLNIVLADRDEGNALVTDRRVRKIAFTGSTASGRRIGAQAGERFARQTLELGGKSAAVFLEDADISTFVEGMANAAFMNNGQTCTGQARVLAPRSRYDEVVEALAEWAESQVIGNPLDSEVTMGPMANKRQLERVLEYIGIGRNDGGRIAAGGGRPTAQRRGWFVEPTIFADVANTDRIAVDEIFGPVVTVIPYSDEGEAIRLANDTPYGLAGSVWTAEEQHGIDIARQLNTGTVGVNYYANDFNAPFGGVGDSGIGRELGPEGLDSFFELKSIYASSALLREVP